MHVEANARKEHGLKQEKGRGPRELLKKEPSGRTHTSPIPTRSSLYFSISGTTSSNS